MNTLSSCFILFGGIILMLCCLLGGCGEEEAVISVTDISEGLIISSKSTEGAVEGEILWQNAGPKVVFQVDTAFIERIEEGIYQFNIFFAERDSLILIVERGEWDYNYHFPDDTVANKLSFVIFNSDTLTLAESALSIQPIEAINSLHTVTNVHTLNAGDWNGTINQVPLVQ